MQKSRYASVPRSKPETAFNAHIYRQRGWSTRLGAPARAAADSCQAPPLDLRGTLAWLERARADGWYRREMPLGARALGTAIGLPTVFMRPWQTGEKYSQASLVALARVIPMIESRALIFPLQRAGRPAAETPQLSLFGWEPEKKAPLFIWTDPPEAPPRLARLAARSAWTLYSRCASCGANRWLPAACGGRPMVACYGCLPPSQYPAIGAGEMAGSLIDAAARAYY